MTGAEACPCFPNDTCNSELTCASGVCVDLSGVGGEPATGGASPSGGVVAAGAGGTAGDVTTGGNGADATTGGMPATGGAEESGGTPDSGGVEASGGSPETGGSEQTGGAEAAGGAGGAPPTGGTSSTGAEAGAGGANGGCSLVGPPLITDFRELTIGDTWSQEGREFGVEGITGVSGGTFGYQADDPSAITYSVTDQHSLRLTADIPAQAYAAFGLSFDVPGGCADATRFTGVALEVSGDLGDTQLQVQLQHAANYPFDASPGTCEFTETFTRWDECTNNYVIREEASGLVELPFADFMGGIPETPVDPAELMGLVLQFNCGGADCPLDLFLEFVTFY